MATAGMGQTFSLSQQFDVEMPQETPWLYGYQNSNSGGFKRLDLVDLLDSIPILTSLLGQKIWKNTSLDTKLSILPGQVSLAPGLLGQPAVARFVAPRDGVVNLSGFFGAGEQGAERTKTIRINGIEIFRDHSGVAKEYFYSLYLRRGDKVDYTVTDRPLTAQNTPVEAQVTYVQPEFIGLPKASAIGGEGMTGTVQMNGVAPEGGMEVELFSNNPAISVPASVTIPAGESTATFSVSSEPVETDQQVQVTARANQGNAIVKLKVLAPRLFKLMVSKKALRGVQKGIATVELTGPTKNGATVHISCDQPSVLQVPSSVNVPAGSKTATFEFKALNPEVQTVVNVTVTKGTRSKTVSITVKPRE